MEVIKAPNLASWDLRGDMTVFLAGSIEMGKAEDWQSMIPGLFKNRGNLTFFNPRRDDWDSSWEQKESNPEFNKQVNWELDHLEKADLIFMYFSPETTSPISLLELGLYADSDKIIVCCPDGFYRKGNVDIVCAVYDIPVYNTLDAAIGRLRTELKNVK
jgi:hypothetical protein